MNEIGLRNFWSQTKGSKFRYRISRLFTELRYAWQRAYKGYDDRDVFDYKDMFLDRTILILQDFRKRRYGLWWCPKGYEIGKFNDDCNHYLLTDEQTDVILETLIFHLKMSNEDFVEKQLYGSCIYDDEYKIGERSMLELKRIESVRQQNQDAAMRLLTLFMNDLWD